MRRRSLELVQERRVEQLDQHPAVLDGFDRVGNLHQFSRGRFRIGVAAFIDSLHLQVSGGDVASHAGDIDLGSAEAFRPARRQLRRQRLPGFLHCVFPCRPGALAPVSGIGAGRDLRFDLRPCRLKASPACSKLAAVPVADSRRPDASANPQPHSH
jgi:hypothetical protein